MISPKAENAGQVKSEPGPPMTLGGAAAARVRLIVYGARIAATKLSPTRPKWPSGTAPKRLCPTGEGG